MRPAAPRKQRRAPTLAELQASFQRAVIDGDDTVLGLIPANSRTTRETLLGVYRHAYVARLVAIAASDYAQLHAFMGADAFDAMARAYIAAHPSHTPNARWVTHRLPEFLAAADPWSGHPELAELSRLERAIADAFDAPDDTAATLDGLRSVPPEQWAALTFAPHGSVQRLDLTTNAHAIWTALKSEMQPPHAERLQEPDRLIVWRQVATSRVRRLGAEEAMLWDEAVKAVPFGALCELAAHFDDPDTAAVRAAQHLAGWLTAGLLRQSA